VQCAKGVFGRNEIASESVMAQRRTQRFREYRNACLFTVSLTLSHRLRVALRLFVLFIFVYFC
jgi:hypothetical protein